MKICLSCGKKKDTGKCNCLLSCVIDVPDGCVTEEKIQKKRNVVTVNDILQNNIKYETIPGYEMFGELPQKVSILLYGKPGGGKSTFALKFANALANMGKNTLFLSLEEKADSATLKKKIINNNIDNNENLFIIDNMKKNPMEIIESYAVKNVFVDSITIVGFDVKKIAEIHEKTQGITLLIAHCTKDEKPKYKGNSDIEHEVDISCLAEQGKLYLKKNRLHWIDENECETEIFQRTVKKCLD